MTQPAVASGMLDPRAVELPRERVPALPHEDAPEFFDFEYAAVKTKLSRSAASSGPPPGSTWLWFLVADVETEDAGEGRVRVKITGDKFQAGWVPDPTKFCSTAQLRSRCMTMLRSVIDGTENEYGLGRKGVPEGFKHDWFYSDSMLRFGKISGMTSDARWTEVKVADRWKVRISLTVSGDVPKELQPGQRHVLVADQRAEKLNANQYATAMRGAAMPAGSRDRKSVVEAVLAEYEKEKEKFAAKSKARPAVTLMSFWGPKTPKAAPKAVPKGSPKGDEGPATQPKAPSPASPAAPVTSPPKAPPGPSQDRKRPASEVDLTQDSPIKCRVIDLTQ
eukprot:TRINITY_DN10246_c0_g2_i1.p1 TRINITY_DN10246_c0_g2~~TRINITY_DN10246_c0_g2_i1.p1  ORF type:complete len:335 (+),score=100.02 TRINITY_DN10246_c0_g2_i1:76-1080(+)